MVIGVPILCGLKKKKILYEKGEARPPRYLGIYTCLPQGYLPNLERTHFPNCSFMVGFREWASAKPTPWSKLKLASIVDCEV